MDSDMIQKVLELLSNRETLAKITDVANNISAAPPRESEQPVLQPPPSLPAIRTETKSNPYSALLYALKPFMREERRSKIDSLVNALSVVSLLNTMKSDGSGQKGASNV